MDEMVLSVALEKIRSGSLLVKAQRLHELTHADMRPCYFALRDFQGDALLAYLWLEEEGLIPQPEPVPASGCCWHCG
jgi:hypothetical protein